MHIREYTPQDLPQLIELTIATFGPYYEHSFRPLVGETVFANEHGNWRQDYHRQVPALHDPDAHQHVAIAEIDGSLAGYVAWDLDPAKHHGNVEMLAVATTARRSGAGTVLCEHAFAHMRRHGVVVAAIGTGGDAFHTPARELYSSLGCTELPISVYYKQL